MKGLRTDLSILIVGLERDNGVEKKKNQWSGQRCNTWIYAEREFGGLDHGDDQAALLLPGNKPLTQIVQDDSFREFEFRQYLFACQSKDDPLYVKVNKLSPTKTQLPYDYYFLNYCKQPKILNSAKNLGEVLHGDRMENSVYTMSICDLLGCYLLVVNDNGI
ncbi:hypothetical protein V6N13_047032 [Hibiscus sabdariffa]